MKIHTNTYLFIKKRQPHATSHRNGHMSLKNTKDFKIRKLDLFLIMNLTTLHGVFRHEEKTFACHSASTMCKRAKQDYNLMMYNIVLEKGVRSNRRHPTPPTY